MSPIAGIVTAAPRVGTANAGPNPGNYVLTITNTGPINDVVGLVPGCTADGTMITCRGFLPANDGDSADGSVPTSLIITCS